MMNSKLAVVFDDVKIITDTISSFGYEIIPTDSVNEFISYERKHADMQCITINNDIFVLPCCDNLINALKLHQKSVVLSSKRPKGDYPNNILLNAKVVSDLVIGKIKNLDPLFVQHCIGRGYRFIDVNQGYSACSICKVTEKAIITADISIYNALKNTDIEVLRISEGYINLHNAKGEEYGFIGGASMKLSEDSILFFGDLDTHPDAVDIRAFCKSQNVSVFEIKDFDLTDIGGCVTC